MVRKKTEIARKSAARLRFVNVGSEKGHQLFGALSSQNGSRYSYADYADGGVLSAEPDTVVVLFSDTLPQSELSDLIDTCRATLSGAIPIVLITDIDNFAFGESCFRKGIKGLMNLQMGVKEMRQALQLVSYGGIYVPPLLLPRIRYE